jgi:hypothetical protein
MDQEELKPRQGRRLRAVRPGARLQRRLAGLNAAGGLLLVAYAALANVSAQVSIQQTLFRGYLLLLLSVAGFLLSALALAGLIGLSLEERAARRELERLPAEARQSILSFQPPAAARFLGRLSDWGTCILWLLLWATVLFITTRLI